MTTITGTAHNRCSIVFSDEDGEHDWEFRANDDGGYVRMTDETGRTMQLCDRLARTGPTLLWSGREPLVEYVRREWRKYRADRMA